MKINQLTAVAAMATLLFACQQTPRGDSAQVTEQKAAAQGEGTAYAVDLQNSTVTFTGNGVGKNHPGVFKLTDGMVRVAANQVTGGQFTIDIQSMQLTETGDGIQNKLRPHLLSPDFFDVAQYPTARFEITDVAPMTGHTATADHNDAGAAATMPDANYQVSGNLTLKNTTKNVTFPAAITVDENQVTARANFNIDRTQWGMSYGNDQSLGDKFISPTVNLKLDLRASRQYSGKLEIKH